ncbi:MAG: NADH-quinone oxidoreductase subunit NuoK [Dehalococcoidia bacterium]|nr:NADH-quinone oxidoreductase subunit NuoK [Dehalococcoidia bacterium]
MTLGLGHFLALGAVLFCTGLYGALVRRNAIVILMSIELMFNAVNVTLVAFSRFVTPTLLTGQVFAIFVITVAAAEAAVALAIIISAYRNRETVDTEQFNLMKW